MHPTLLLATFALSTLAAPISQPLNSRTDIHDCYRANSRSEHSVDTRAENPKRVCKISHPRDIDEEQYNNDADAHHAALGDRRSALPEPVFRAGSGRREVDRDDRVIIETRNSINEESRSAGRTQTRSPEPEPITRKKNGKRQPKSLTKFSSSYSQQSNGSGGGGYVRPAQKRTVEEDSDAHQVNEDEFDSEALALELGTAKETVEGRENKGSAESLPSDGIILATRGAGRTQARGAGRTQARGAGRTQARHTDQEHQSVENQIDGRAIRNESRNAEPEPVIRPVPGGRAGNRGGKSSNKRAVLGPGGGSQCRPGTWFSRC